VALAVQVVGAVLVVAGFALLAPFAGVIVAGAMLVSFGVAMERSGR
jgi:uncharacterized membrane protein